jgi:hypothetical protein
MWIRNVTVSLLLLVWLAAPPARGDELTDQAKRDVAAGLAAQSAGNYDEAIALYKKAFDAVPHPEILFDLGQAYRLKGDAETALGYYRRYLAVAPSGRVARDARRWIAELSKRVAAKARESGRAAGPAQPVASATVEPDPKRPAAPAPSASAGAAPAAASGSTALPGQGPVLGPPPTTAITTAPAADRSGALVATGAQPPVATSARPPAGVAATRAAPDPAAQGTGRGTYAWIAAGAGSAALIGGLVFGGLARTKLDDATQICGGDHRCDTSDELARANALLAQSRTRGTVSTVLVAAGVAGLAASAALWWTGRRADAPRIAVAPVVSRDSFGVALGAAY